MKEQKEKTENLEVKTDVEGTDTAKEVSPTWAQDCIEDLDDFIESQGIYLRQ